jgi:hypothetical protein
MKSLFRLKESRLAILLTAARLWRARAAIIRSKKLLRLPA